MGPRYRKVEIELSPHLLKKLFEYVKGEPSTDFSWLVTNLVELSKCDDLLTLDEYELAIRKPGTM